MPSGHPPSPNSLIVGNCIACSGLVRVSATANANADVRCPHCQQTFPLVRLLESAVPEVEVVEPQVATVKKQPQKLYIDQTAETKKDSFGKFVVPSQLAKGARRRKSSRSRSDSSRSRSSSSRSETERSSRRRSDSRSHSDARPSARRQSETQERIDERVDETSYRERHLENEPRDAVPLHHHSDSESLDREQERLGQPRRSSDHSEPPISSHRSTRHRDARAAEALKTQPNPAADFLKMVAGACLALPIAYLVVMWVFTQDPLRIGRGLAEKLPFLVPAALHAQTEHDVEANDAPEVEKGFLDFSDDEGSLEESFESIDINIGGKALKGLDL